MSERTARGERAQRARDDIFTPILSDIRKSYSDRLVEVASKELNPAKREQAITSLSVAIRILDNIESGITAIINDGEMAKRDELRADKIEKMSKPERRLFSIAPR
jgi:hypothetical protein